MKDLAAALGEAASRAFVEAGLEARFGRVTPSDRPELADFQVNGALAAAKIAGRNPREIAAEVAERLRGDPRLASVEVAGPGFINLRLTDAALAERAQAIATDPRAGGGLVDAPRRVLIDYGGPNVAKEMHVGHLRSSIIGESLKRLYRFRGDEVVGDAHFGDWGFQMGLLITAILDEHPAIIATLVAPLCRRAAGLFSEADQPGDRRPAHGPRDARRPRPDLSGRCGAGEGRRGFPRPRPAGHGRAAGWPVRLPPAVAPLPRSDARRAGARFPRVGHRLRPLEGRERRQRSDRADGRGASRKGPALP